MRDQTPERAGRSRALFSARSSRRLAGVWLALGFAFLYLPIGAMAVFSFNESALPGRWSGFTLQWYRSLLEDGELRAALWLSVRIALLSATLSVALGCLAALSLVRWARFPGRSLFNAMLSAPLVMPEIIIGLSLLLMLVSAQNLLGLAQRGWFTMVLGHVLLGMAYATVVIQARLKGMNPQLEEAAMDLGARPWQAFWLVTLPYMAPAMMAAWLLTFTLSLDDVLISAFLSGPGSTTLPLVMLSRARLGIHPSLYAVATLVVLAATLAVLVVCLSQAHRDRRLTPAGPASAPPSRAG